MDDGTDAGRDWLRILAGFARIQSRAYQRLFSMNATRNSEETYLQELDNVYGALSTWKDSLPEPFRLGPPLRPRRFQRAHHLAMATRLHLQYYNLLIALSRLALHICHNPIVERQSASKARLLSAARSIIDLTHNLHISPSTQAV